MIIPKLDLKIGETDELNPKQYNEPLIDLNPKQYNEPLIDLNPQVKEEEPIHIHAVNQDEKEVITTETHHGGLNPMFKVEEYIEE